ncbi:hypothetical protein BDK51DRAFT_47001 [Blyttiomyces helicus]|uniref:Uncharacterized protein n=1 Tax=Blyttiomyces helicus TaxID=388810 RepID=A0A4P9WNH9_9FUNG|nr:hypothetical protein BDK51DRAFT_47001 [Blyttiomyces helicus]|eukprot:RKO94669.1 hypothetical protein BDK51DRAFT_47001 [Blyttiomyces helicus]
MLASFASALWRPMMSIFPSQKEDPKSDIHDHLRTKIDLARSFSNLISTLSKASADLARQAACISSLDGYRNLHIHLCHPSITDLGVRPTDDAWIGSSPVRGVDYIGLLIDLEKCGQTGLSRNKAQGNGIVVSVRGGNEETRGLSLTFDPNTLSWIGNESDADIFADIVDLPSQTSTAIMAKKTQSRPKLSPNTREVLAGSQRTHTEFVEKWFVGKLENQSFEVVNGNAWKNFGAVGAQKNFDPEVSDVDSKQSGAPTLPQSPSLGISLPQHENSSSLKSNPDALDKAHTAQPSELKLSSAVVPTLDLMPEPGVNTEFNAWQKSDTAASRAVKTDGSIELVQKHRRKTKSGGKSSLQSSSIIPSLSETPTSPIRSSPTSPQTSSGKIEMSRPAKVISPNRKSKQRRKEETQLTRGRRGTMAEMDAEIAIDLQRSPRELGEESLIFEGGTPNAFEAARVVQIIWPCFQPPEVERSLPVVPALDLLDKPVLSTEYKTFQTSLADDSEGFIIITRKHQQKRKSGSLISSQTASAGTSLSRLEKFTSPVKESNDNIKAHKSSKSTPSGGLTSPQRSSGKIEPATTETVNNIQAQPHILSDGFTEVTRKGRKKKS